MPIKCYRKPNRKEKRRFTVCDAARIAEKAAISGFSRDEVMGAVGFRLGYYMIVNGSTFTEGELQREIQEVLTAGDIIAELSVIFPASTVWRLFLRLATAFSTKFATLLAPIVLYLLKKHEIKATTVCNR